MCRVYPSAVALLKHTQFNVLCEFMPVIVSGDSNCLYQSMSYAMYRMEDFYLLHALSATEVLSNRNLIDVSSDHCMNPHANCLRPGSLGILPSIPF